MLGYSRAVICWVFPDQRADSVDQLDINRAVEGIIERSEPDIVYTHHPGDLNLDHRRVAEAVLVETRGRLSVQCMTPEWPGRCIGPPFLGTVRVDITETLAQKVAACRCYVDELRPWPHPRSIQAIQAQTVELFDAYD